MSSFKFCEGCPALNSVLNEDVQLHSCKLCSAYNSSAGRRFPSPFPSSQRRGSPVNPLEGKSSTKSSGREPVLNPLEGESSTKSSEGGCLSILRSSGWGGSWCPGRWALIWRSRGGGWRPPPSRPARWSPSTAPAAAAAEGACQPSKQILKSFPSRIPDPHTKNLGILAQNNGFYALGNMIWVVHPGSGSRFFWFFTHPGSRGQKSTGSRIRIATQQNTNVRDLLATPKHNNHKFYLER